ncbi:otubain, partial [Trifolium medium]|nr:otubain [Trifolium medium]
IQLKPDSPIPQTNRMWDKHHLKSADNWPCRYAHRMESYNNLKRAHGGTVVGDKIKEVIYVEDDRFVVQPVDLAHD